MNKFNVAAIAGIFALAAVLGTMAATRTTSLGTAQQQSANAAAVAKSKQLDRFQASLARALAHKPPALPKAGTSAAAPAAGSAAPRIVYHRPPPIVVVRHVHRGDDGSREAAGGGEGGDG